MPAKSKAQFRKMAMCAHNPQHAQGECPDKATAEEFLHGGYKHLPERVKQRVGARKRMRKAGFKD